MSVRNQNGIDFSTRLSVALKSVVTAYREKRDRLRVNAGAEYTAKPTVFFLTPDHQAPAGGIQVIYRHVDILNSAGINACVLHQRRGFRCTWFENETPVCYIDDTRVLRGDILVLPEICVSLASSLPLGIRYVVFNQNTHLTWKNDNEAVRRAYRASGDFVGALTVSKHNCDMLQYAFPEIEVSRIHLGIDPETFYPASSQRSKRIAYMPRRGLDDAKQVLRLLERRSALDGWEIVALSGLSHQQVAEELSRTRVFLAFTRQEGFGLPAAEAMACGCYVIGNDGFAGSEFFKDEFASSVATGDVLGFAETVERIVEHETTEPGWCELRGSRASRFIHSEYSLKRERDEVVSAYTSFLGIQRERALA
ncbi:glycosyltransferase [Rhizobium sp. 2MFCol3.1]|uniref:glycosyltransferase n=1 Tax=Rhizobium sp. 2MFCol3.1 TaxID=1246459 RepID=UPI00037D54F3|nr:glycosyltransferase [Rhizobium sp. 2MFCol3.1]